jgi:hypothetical protein
MLICAPPIKKLLKIFQENFFEIIELNHYSHSQILNKKYKKQNFKKLKNQFSIYAFLLKKKMK